MESSLHGAACGTYMSATSKERCHLRHINILIGTHADLVLQYTGLIHENRTVDSLNIAQLVHNAIQISRYRIVEIHGLTVHHAHDTATVHEAYALHQSSAHNLCLQICLLIKAFLDQLGKIESERDQKCCCLQCLRCRIGILEYAGIVDDAGIQCFRNISVNKFGIHDVIQYLAGTAHLGTDEIYITAAGIADVMIDVDLLFRILKILLCVSQSVSTAIQRKIYIKRILPQTLGLNLIVSLQIGKLFGRLL